MPLQSGSSREAISANISTERHAGKPEKQAIAIAMNKSRGDAESAKDLYNKWRDLADKVRRTKSGAKAAEYSIEAEKYKKLYQEAMRNENVAKKMDACAERLDSLATRVRGDAETPDSKRCRDLMVECDRARDRATGENQAAYEAYSEAANMFDYASKSYAKGDKDRGKQYEIQGKKYAENGDYAKKRNTGWRGDSSTRGDVAEIPYKQVMQKIRDGNWEATQDVVEGKLVEIIQHDKPGKPRKTIRIGYDSSRGDVGIPGRATGSSKQEFITKKRMAWHNQRMNELISSGKSRDEASSLAAQELKNQNFEQSWNTRRDSSTPDLARERDQLEKRIISTSSEALRQALRLRLSKVEDKLQGVRGDAGALVNESTVSRAVIEIKNVAKNLFGGDLAKGLAEWKSDHPDTDYGTLKQISSRVGVGSRSDTSPNYKRADDTYRVKRSSGPNGPDTFFVQSNREECVGDKEFKTKSEAESYARQCAARDAKNPPDEDDYGYGDATSMQEYQSSQKLGIQHGVLGKSSQNPHTEKGPGFHGYESGYKSGKETWDLYQKNKAKRGDATNSDYKLNRLGQMIHNLHKRMMK